MMKTQHNAQALKASKSNAQKGISKSLPQNSSHQQNSSHFDIDVPKMMKRLKMKVDKEKQLGEVLEKATKVMTMNAIQNILHFSLNATPWTSALIYGQHQQQCSWPDEEDVARGTKNLQQLITSM